jgi:Holliday junction resolvasome RuvABC endonuclease subunit
MIDLFRDTTPDVVVIERPFAAGKSDLANLPGHLVFIAHEQAFAWKLAREEVTPGQWRKAVLGSGKMKRTEAKKAALAWCRDRGLSPRDDNAAEALCLLRWFEMTGGT